MRRHDVVDGAILRHVTVALGMGLPSSGGVGRAVAAGAAFAVAACCGVLGALIAAAPSVGLWVALGVLVIVGAALQGAVTASEHRSGRRVLALGAGAVAAGGSAQDVRTKVHGAPSAVARMEAGEVIATAVGDSSDKGDAHCPAVVYSIALLCPIRRSQGLLARPATGWSWPVPIQCPVISHSS